VTWELIFSDSAGDNSYLLFCDDFDISCTFFMFKSCSMDNQYSLLWVMRKLNFSKRAEDKSYLLFYDDFNVLTTFFKIQPGSTQNEFYESPCNSTFLKLPVTAETAGSTRVSESARHSGSLRPVRPKTNFLRHERRKNVTPQKVPRTTYTSCFTMTFMSLLHSASFSHVRRKTSFFRQEKSTLQKMVGTTFWCP